MTANVADELTALVNSTSQILLKLDEKVVVYKPSRKSWSVKEILGHLVDSVSNNHQRFVRAQEVHKLEFPKYEQDSWVKLQAYNKSPWGELVELWRLYNLHLARVIRRLPHDKLQVECWIEPEEPNTLQFLVEDYLVHLKHHLIQIQDRCGEYATLETGS